MFIQVRAKCMECGLHFTVHTWYPERHVGTTLYCPECGQHEQRFMTWVAEVEGEIFQHVPGDARDGNGLDTIYGHPVGETVDLGVVDIIRIETDDDADESEED